MKDIAGVYSMDLWDAEQEGTCALSDYDLIGFASGTDFGKFYPGVTKLAKTLPEGKRVIRPVLLDSFWEIPYDRKNWSLKREKRMAGKDMGFMKGYLANVNRLFQALAAAVMILEQTCRHIDAVNREPPCG